MKVANVKIVSKRNLHKENSVVLKCCKGKPWRLLFIKVFQCDDNDIRFIWTCPFTPWRLFATFFVKSSKYYKARVESW